MTENMETPIHIIKKNTKDNNTTIESIKNIIQKDKIKLILNLTIILLIHLDIFFVVIIFILVLLVLSGFVSLCERRILALVQLRIGPALFLFGLLTPITDGIKLFIKFTLFVVSFESIYLFGGLTITLFCIFLPWFLFPLGFIILFDKGLSLFILLGVHLFCNVFSVFLVGCFLFSSCFVYLAAMRTLFFSILTESTLLILLYCFYLLDFFSFFGIKDLCVGQLMFYNIYFLGPIFVCLFWICLLADTLRLPFDYMECESELVAGLVTELSGAFFVIYSVLEINHLLLATLLFCSLCFGGLFICFKSILILVFCFFVPRVICFRLKITTAQTFILLFLFSLGFLVFLFLAVTKLFCLLI